jgi:aminobenzoyl-glutamate utilization protein B
VEKAYARVLKIIEAAAIMTETTYKVQFKSGVHETLANRAGSEIVYANLLLVGPPPFTEEEQNFAKEIQKNVGVEPKGLSTAIRPFSLPEKSWGSGSTDVAEVSWLTPTTGLGIAFKPLGTPGHHWSAVACSGMSIGHKTLAAAAKVMAASCLDFLSEPKVLARMRAEWTDKKKGREYKSPLPADLKPPVRPRKG